MTSLSPRYRARLDALSWFSLLGLALPPLALGFAIAGVPASMGIVGGALILGLVRPRRSDALPGTGDLPRWQAPGLFALVESLARRAGLNQVPELRWVPDGQVNAAATLRGNRAVLVVTEALVEALDPRRLGAVLAHEIAHIAHRDLLVFRVAHLLHAATLCLAVTTALLCVLSVLVDPGTALTWAVVAAASPPVSRLLMAYLSRTREFAADLGSASLTGDPGALAEALASIEYQPRTWWQWVLGPQGPPAGNPTQRAFRTHPPTPERIRRLAVLARWAR